MSSNHKCRICSSPDLHRAIELPNSPASISRLFKPNEISLDSTSQIDIYKCCECGFVQHFNFVSDDFYDDYIMTVTHSPQMCIYQEKQAKHFIEYFNLSKSNIIEVGCGDGNYMGYLKKHSTSVTGIEPSSSFRREAEKAGHKVLSGYVGEKTPVPGAPYDAFVTRQVLEHVPDPLDFLRGIQNSLTPNGVGLVEVPSLEQALGGGRFFDLFRDHVNYFTFQTLLRTLTTVGFETIHLDRGMNGEFLVAYVRRSNLIRLEELGEIRRSLSQQIRDFVNNIQSSGKRVAVWGAGGKGLSCMAAAGGAGISYVIDSDPYKIGRITPVAHLEVFSPKKLKEDPVDAVILTSLAYRNEIIDQLRGQLGFKGVIAVIGQKLEVIED